MFNQELSPQETVTRGSALAHTGGREILAWVDVAMKCGRQF